MNKTEFIAAVAEKAGLTKADAQRAVNAFTEVVKETMEKGDRLPLVGFGTFSVSQRKARRKESSHWRTYQDCCSQGSTF